MSIVLSWRDANGLVTALTEANGYRVLRGATGLGAAAPDNIVDSYVGFDGAALVSRRRNTHTVILPLFVQHASRAQTLVGQLTAMLQGPGQLEYADGTNTRTLRNVIYNGGLEGDMSNAPNPTWRKVVVSLLALDPWWYGGAQSQVLSTAATTAFSAGIPFSDTIPFSGGNTASLFVDGAGEAFPVTTVVGPATTLTVSVGFNGWSIAAPLSGSDTLVVDTRPGSRGPRLNGGPVNWALLTAASRLWTLDAGTQAIVAGATGATGAVLTVAWEPRYLTP